MKNKMPKLFDVEIEDTDEVKASNFIGYLLKKDFVGINMAYFNNYINAEIEIALAHIKQNYKKYVCEGTWSEEKFEGVIMIVARDRKMLIPAVLLQYGMKFDDGKLIRDIEIEKRKYGIATVETSKKETQVSDEEQELLDYIEKNGGR